ncbi:transposase, partial [Candidatus Micrarchaeota archaeon]|nr:transposase [Candidatus Micrarchaeota archaeon]
MEEEIRAYRFRLYPSKDQTILLNQKLNLCKQLYNTLLEKCKNSYKESSISLCSRHEMNRIINNLKTNKPEFRTVYSQSLQDARDRVLRAFTNFFRRVKEKKKGKKIKAGFPRFKKFYKSITYPQNNGSFEIKNGKTLHIAKVGNIPIVKHREIDGTIKTLTLKRTQSGKWHAIFTSILPKKVIIQSRPLNRTGIDVGIESFATLSNGTKIQNPRHLLNSEKKLKKLQRKLSRKKPGSKNRRKAKLKVA